MKKARFLVLFLALALVVAVFVLRSAAKHPCDSSKKAARTNSEPKPARPNNPAASQGEGRDISTGMSQVPPQGAGFLLMDFEVQANYYGNIIVLRDDGTIENVQKVAILHRKQKTARIDGLAPGSKSVVVVLSVIAPFQLTVEVRKGENFLKVPRETISKNTLVHVVGHVCDVDGQPVYDATITYKFQSIAVGGSSPILYKDHNYVASVSETTFHSDGTHVQLRTTPTDGGFDIWTNGEGKHLIEIEYEQWKGNATVDTAQADNRITIPVKAKPPPQDDAPVWMPENETLESLVRKAAVDQDEKSKLWALDITRHLKELKETSPETRAKIEELENKFKLYLDLRSGMERDAFEDTYAAKLGEEVGEPLDEIRLDLYMKWLLNRDK